MNWCLLFLDLKQRDGTVRYHINLAIHAYVFAMDDVATLPRLAMPQGASIDRKSRRPYVQEWLCRWGRAATVSSPLR